MSRKKIASSAPVLTGQEVMLAKVAAAQGEFDKSLQQLTAARDNCIRKGQQLFSARAAADDVMLRSIDDAIAGMKRSFTGTAEAAGQS